MAHAGDLESMCLPINLSYAVGQGCPAINPHTSTHRPSNASDLISPCAQNHLQQLPQLLLQLLPLLACARALPHVALEGAVQVQQGLI